MSAEIKTLQEISVIINNQIRENEIRIRELKARVEQSQEIDFIIYRRLERLKEVEAENE